MDYEWSTPRHTKILAHMCRFKYGVKIGVAEMTVILYA